MNSKLFTSKSKAFQKIRPNQRLVKRKLKNGKVVFTLRRKRPSIKKRHRNKKRHKKNG